MKPHTQHSLVIDLNKAGKDQNEGSFQGDPEVGVFRTKLSHPGNRVVARARSIYAVNAQPDSAKPVETEDTMPGNNLAPITNDYHV